MKHSIVVSICVLTVALPARAAEDLSGRWALVQVTTAVASIPVVGDVLTRTRALSLLDVTHRGDRMQGRGRVCSVAIDSGTRLVRTIVPRALVRSLPPPRLDARLRQRNGRTFIQQERQTVVLGAELVQPLRDPLPTSAADKRVRDHDADGRPGVTVRVEGLVSGEMHVVQRSWSELTGMRRGSGFTGGIRFHNEQVVLHASSWMLSDPPETKPSYERSYFRLEPVPRGTSCERAARLTAEWK